MVSRIIHSGLFPEERKASTTSRRLMARTFFCPLAFSTSSRSSFAILSRSNEARSSLIASAPIPARKLLPNLSTLSLYSFSVKTCFGARGVLPGSITT